MAQLNFLPPKQLILEKDKRLQDRLLIFSSVILFLAVVISGTLWVYSSVLEKNISDLSVRKSVLIAGLATNRDKILMLNNIHQKSLGIEKIFSMHFDYSKALSKFLQVVPDGIGLDTLDIDTKGEVSASLNASGSSALKDFVAQITKPENKYDKIVLGEIAIQNSQSFGLTVGFTSK